MGWLAEGAPARCCRERGGDGGGDDGDGGGEITGALQNTRTEKQQAMMEFSHPRLAIESAGLGRLWTCCMLYLLHLSRRPGF